MTAYERIVAYVEAEELTLQELQDLNVVGIALAAGLTLLDLRGKDKLKAKLIEWYQVKLRAVRINQLQNAIRNIPLMGDTVVEDIDRDLNIVKLYIDGVA